MNFCLIYNQYDEVEINQFHNNPIVKKVLSKCIITHKCVIFPTVEDLRVTSQCAQDSNIDRLVTSIAQFFYRRCWGFKLHTFFFSTNQCIRPISFNKLQTGGVAYESMQLFIAQCHKKCTICSVGTCTQRCISTHQNARSNCKMFFKLKACDHRHSPIRWAELVSWSLQWAFDFNANGIGRDDEKHTLLFVSLRKICLYIFFLFFFLSMMYWVLWTGIHET